MGLETDPIDVLSEAILQQIRSTEMLELQGRAQNGKAHRFTVVTGNTFQRTAGEITKGRNAILVHPASTEIAVIIVNPKTGLVVRKSSLLSPARIHNFAQAYITKGDLSNFNELLSGKVEPITLFKQIVTAEDVLLDIQALGNQALDDFRRISASGIGSILINGLDIVPPNPIVRSEIDLMMQGNNLPATNLVGLQQGFLFGHEQHEQYKTVGSWDGTNFTPYLTGRMEA